MPTDRLDPEDPALLAIHAKRLAQRDLDQLLGVCEYALQDGTLEQHEAESLLTWLRTHPGCLDNWPASVLYDRLVAALADGVMDPQEQSDLLGLLLRIVPARAESGLVVPAALPLSDPLPPVVIPARTFCFTGVFEFGPRAACQQAVIERGGAALNGITRKLHYLVIGSIGSEVWRHSSFGTKIIKAVEYRDAGVPLAIVSEPHWRAALA